jgi:microcystin-dependent protein
MSATLASLLPNGEQQFSDANGVPYARGKVYFYIPNTSTLKNTWQDPLQVTPNTNPVTLDSAGRAIIYGSGQYRQVLQDSLGNTIWDQLTSSNLEGSGVFWGGTATGGGNTYNITIGTAATAYYAGMQVAFISDFSNTGAAQIDVTNVNGVNLGTVNLYKQTSAGIAPMTGGEVPLGNIINAEFDGTQFQVINPISYQEPTGIIKIYGGSTAPSGYLLCFGQLVSRTTFANLFAVIGTSFGIGDGATTFGIPDLRGNVPAGVDNMGGTPANRITTAIAGFDGTVLGNSGGTQSMQSHTHVATDSGHTHLLDGNSGAGGAASVNQVNGNASVTTSTSTHTGFAVITNATTGAGNSQNVQPTIMLNFVIKT